MPTPRILQVVLSLHPGGTERLVLELAKRLTREMPTAICCLDDRGEWAEEAASQDIVVTNLARRPGFHPMLGHGIALAAAAHGATVVHAHHYSPFVYAGLARLWRPNSFRVVFTEHGRLSDAGPSPKRRLANQLIGRLASRVFTVSDDVRQHLIAEGFAGHSVGVIFNGIDVGPMPTALERQRVRAQLGVTDDTFVIGTVARLDPVKDLGTLLRAAATLPRTRRVAMVVIGDGPERQALEQLAGQLGVSADIHFLGQRGDARDWLAGCDVYANSSISEGVSLTILEGMAACLPLVVTAVGGTPEVVDASCGRLVPPRNAEALAGALENLAADASLRSELGVAARRRVEERFTLHRMVGEYRDVYRTLSNARGD